MINFQEKYERSLERQISRENHYETFIGLLLKALQGDCTDVSAVESLPTITPTEERILMGIRQLKKKQNVNQED